MATDMNAAIRTQEFVQPKKSTKREKVKRNKKLRQNETPYSNLVNSDQPVELAEGHDVRRLALQNTDDDDFLGEYDSSTSPRPHSARENTVQHLLDGSLSAPASPRDRRPWENDSFKTLFADDEPIEPPTTSRRPHEETGPKLFGQAPPGAVDETAIWRRRHKGRLVEQIKGSDAGLSIDSSNEVCEAIPLARRVSLPPSAADCTYDHLLGTSCVLKHSASSSHRQIFARKSKKFSPTTCTQDNVFNPVNTSTTIASASDIRALTRKFLPFVLDRVCLQRKSLDQLVTGEQQRSEPSAKKKSRVKRINCSTKANNECSYHLPIRLRRKQVSHAAAYNDLYPTEEETTRADGSAKVTDVDQGHSHGDIMKPTENVQDPQKHDELDLSFPNARHCIKPGRARLLRRSKRPLAIETEDSRNPITGVGVDKPTSTTRRHKADIIEHQAPTTLSSIGGNSVLQWGKRGHETDNRQVYLAETSLITRKKEVVVRSPIDGSIIARAENDINNDKKKDLKQVPKNQTETAPVERINAIAGLLTSESVDVSDHYEDDSLDDDEDEMQEMSNLANTCSDNDVIEGTDDSRRSFGSVSDFEAIQL